MRAYMAEMNVHYFCAFSLIPGLLERNLACRGPNREVKKDFLLRVPMVWLQLRWSRQKNPQCISADTPPPLLTLRRDPYEVRLDVALAKSGPVFLSTPPPFAQNPRNAHDGTFFHHPANAKFATATIFFRPNCLMQDNPKLRRTYCPFTGHLTSQGARHMFWSRGHG